MRLLLPSGKQIGTDRMVTGTVRFDSTPVVANLEFQCLLDDEFDAALQEGKEVILGDGEYRFTIIKRVVNRTSILRDDQPLVIGAYIAVLSGCENMFEPAARAIYLNDAGFAAVLRSSGCKVPVAEDIPLINFFCPVGETATYIIAKKLREEAAFMHCSADSKIIVKRLQDAVKAEPKLTLSPSAVSWISNNVEVKHDVPNYITLNQDGSTIEGEIKAGMKAEFYPNLDARRVRNLSTAIVTKGTVTRSYTPNLICGDVILVDQDTEAKGSDVNKYVVITAAHRFDTGILGGATASVTKLWLGQVEQL